MSPTALTVPPIAVAPRGPGQALARLRSGAAHPAAWLASLAFVAAWLAGLTTRAALMVAAGGAVSPGAALAILGRGALADGAWAATLAAALLAVGALTHGSGHARLRHGVRIVAAAVLLFALLFVGLAEWLFWAEFSTRFNFIAVDYLIYTTEVVGNVRESYPVGTLLGVLAAFALPAAAIAVRAWPPRAARAWRPARRVAVALLAAATASAAARAGLWLHDRADLDDALRGHAAHAELARNGPLAFVAALRDNALPFERFYATVPPASVDALAGAWPRRRAATTAVPVAATPPGQFLAAASPGRARRPRHVVVIQVESLSAEYLGAFGNPRGLTPNLDRIAASGVLFTNLYAIGTRTVRGLEALSAALPPLPGQSVVRRPDNAGLVTLGGVLREHGFRPQFLYGGYGVFDNMNAWFAGSGYAVRDRSDFPDAHARFSTVWGVADEHLFDDAIDVLDRETTTGRAFLHLMTTSNHRPYAYPDDRIDIASKSGRDGAVKYTDWAIGRFLDAARTRPWFDDTLFVVVADHCASVAGRTRLPPDRYHIPAVFYAPGYLAPGRVDHLASQIDLAPTLLAWLGIDDGGRFLGQDLFGTHVEQRAYLGNYQEIGLLVPAGDGGRDLVVLAPRRRVSQFRVARDGNAMPIDVDPALARRAIATFQQADRLVADGRYRLAPRPALRPVVAAAPPDGTASGNATASPAAADEAATNRDAPARTSGAVAVKARDHARRAERRAAVRAALRGRGRGAEPVSSAG